MRSAGRPRRNIVNGHGSVADAVARTVATAGRTVLVSGVTVAIVLASLMLFPETILRSIGGARRSRGRRGQLQAYSPARGRGPAVGGWSAMSPAGAMDARRAGFLAACCLIGWSWREGRSEYHGGPVGPNVTRAGRVNRDNREVRQSEPAGRPRRREDRVNVHFSARGRDARPRVPWQRRRTWRDCERDPEDQAARGGGGELHGDDVSRADGDSDRAERWRRVRRRARREAPARR
jgi:MMPL family